MERSRQDVGVGFSTQVHVQISLSFVIGLVWFICSSSQSHL